MRLLKQRKKKNTPTEQEFLDIVSNYPQLTIDIKKKIAKKNNWSLSTFNRRLSSLIKKGKIKQVYIYEVIPKPTD